MDFEFKEPDVKDHKNIEKWLWEDRDFPELLASVDANYHGHSLESATGLPSQWSERAWGVLYGAGAALFSLLTQLEAEADAGNWHQASALLQPLGSLVHGRLPRADEAAIEGADGDAMVGVRSMYMAIAEQVHHKLIT